MPMVSRIAILAGCALLAGCGGSTASAPRSQAPHSEASGGQASSGSSARATSDALAVRVCGAARQAAAKAFGSAMSLRIVSPAAVNLECVLTGRQVQVTINSQAGPSAYTEFDTELSHQAQVFGNGGANNPAQQPVPATVPGVPAAIWIPAQQMIVATDSTPAGGSSGVPAGAGAYVTVAVGGRAAPAKAALRVATAVTAATFAAHPDGSL
ncbi:MAG TPA: hypothetical protein VHF26_13630 [Trebonia sp.]|nr:hypothetical protein [Trebonia sp.]